MLSESQRSQLEKVLLEERERLIRAAKDGLKFSMERERSIGRDSIDESMEEELFSTELRLRDREKYLLNKINGALDRLENRTIDECEDCGEVISFRRLMARPVTTLCIDCKEEKEKEELSKNQIMGRTGVSHDETMGDHSDDE